MKDNKKHVPVRTCISCGTKRRKKELIRLVLDVNGLLMLDDNGKGQGRGAYVCPDRSCWEGLKKSKHISRAFKKNGPLAFHPDFRLE